MIYRPEIDGLRAISVISIILFHAGFQVFSGGFVGVDIFFVISGYLITTIITKEKEKGVFSLLNFYERRVRRIIPALFIVLFVSIPFAWLWLLPSEMKAFSVSLIYVLFFISNIFFSSEDGYWDSGSELKPLLHTWSLSVEEQYYIFFPLLLSIIWRFRIQWIITILVVIGTISLSIAQWKSYNKPIENFFLLTTRGWEFSIGSIISLYFTCHENKINKNIKNILELLGLSLIGYAIFFFNENTPFPSFYALIPTIGAGIIIAFSDTESIIGKILSARFISKIGIVSYSAYLWHQPIFSFARHRTLSSKNIYFILIPILFFISYLSWKYIETPFRKQSFIKKRYVYIFSTIGFVFFLLFGFIGKTTEGFDFRIARKGLQMKEIEKKTRPNYGLNPICDGSFKLSSKCRTSNKPEILIFGDSYAMHIANGILGSNPDAKIIQMTKSVCGPFFDIAPVDSKHPINWAKSCLEFTGKVRDWLKGNHTIKYTVLSSTFIRYLNKDMKVLLRNGNLVDANLKLAISEFEKTLDELKSIGVKTIIFSPPPIAGNDYKNINTGRCLERALFFGIDLNECNFKNDELNNKIVYKFLKNFEKKYNIVYMNDIICDKKGTCNSHIDSTFIYRDAGHLSIDGSFKLGRDYNFYKIITR